MPGVPYPSRDETTEIVFRESFPKVVYEPYRTYYIKVSMGNGYEGQIRMKAKQQLAVIDELITRDKKILNASVISADGVFRILSHSPQSDFFSLVEKGY